jgi:hypothetical protein
LVGFTIFAGSIAGCGGGTDSAVDDAAGADATEAGLTRAIEDYWDLLASEQYTEAYAVLSDGCREEIGESEFVAGFRELFAQVTEAGFDPGAQVVRIDIDGVEPGGNERVRNVQWSLAPADAPASDETVSITGGDQDVWAFDDAWRVDVPECGGGKIASSQARE